MPRLNNQELFIVKRPDGLPDRTAYRIDVMADRRARQLGGEVVEIDWDWRPLESEEVEEDGEE